MYLYFFVYVIVKFHSCKYLISFYYKLTVPVTTVKMFASSYFFRSFTLVLGSDCCTLLWCWFLRLCDPWNSQPKFYLQGNRCNMESIFEQINCKISNQPEKGHQRQRQTILCAAYHNLQSESCRIRNCEVINIVRKNTTFWTKTRPTSWKSYEHKCVNLLHKSSNSVS